MVIGAFAPWIEKKDDRNVQSYSYDRNLHLKLTRTPSELFGSGNSMSPNSDETTRMGRFPYLDDPQIKEKQRPPIYNPEDYSILLKKWGKKSANGMISLYTNSSTSELECSRSQSTTLRDYRNPMLTSSGSEMTLRQFGTVSELLAKLKSDLRLAYPSQPPQPSPCPCACTIPVIADHLPKAPVLSPYDPNTKQCGCSVCVPVVVPKAPECPPKPRRRCKYIQPARPKSYAPLRKFVPPELPMEDNTIYRKSYIPVEGEKPGPILPKKNICLGEGKMSDNTINRMSYQPHKAKPPCPIYPCEHKLIGEGPMQDITTQKHDYVPKPFVKPDAIRPFTNLYVSDCPLSDKTINRLSYMPVDLDKAKVQAIRPHDAMPKPCGKISDKTIQKMSYQPWQPQEPIDMPWAMKPKFQPPKLRMEDNTIQKMSYMPPGQYVECADNDPDAVDCPEPPCNPDPCAGPKGCCNPCCCPKAAFNLAEEKANLAALGYALSIYASYPLGLKQTLLNTKANTTNWSQASLFVQEFVADPLDGVTLLLDLLRAIQLSQSSNAHNLPGSSSTTGKIPPSVQRRTLLDELSCLQCLQNCCMRYSEAVRKLISTSAGLFTLAICIMSNVNKSRVIALQLLTKACESPTNGHAAVSEAMSTLRLRFGEPARFRFLVGMLSSAMGQKELLVAGMKFLNRFLDTAGSAQNRLYIQAELEQAGFDIATIKKNIGNNMNSSDNILEEIDRWEKKFIDVETLSIRLENVEKENDQLRDKILLLERRVQILQEEKGILVSLEQCLKEKCSELQVEVHSLKSVKQTSQTSLSKKDGSTPEDEGISSSERSLTPEDEVQRESSVYELYNLGSETIPLGPPKPKSDEEEETTIEEKLTKKEEQNKADERKRIEEAQVASKLQMHVDIDAIPNECEIIPSNLHPQPPRKTRSLVHLFEPSEDYDFCNKELFFENETAFTSEEGSDSLLSASKCRLPKAEKEQIPQIERGSKTRRCRRLSSKSSVKRTESFKQKMEQQKIDLQSGSVIKIIDSKHQRMKCKSLDRIDDGLDTFVDIVVTNQSEEKTQFQTKSDSGNFTGTSLCRSISNVFISPKREIRSRLSTHSDEKQKMFLPMQKDYGEVPYYFPRIQEKRNSASTNFLIKRGHTNAGLYSGQMLIDSHVVINSKSKEINSGPRLIGKVTDLPSGLY
ncbi:hypothetical protein NQ317_015774 [Molorchus minor]|uniref:GBD/FH3 domain-containing protein n=1 Tax=Molorchus minor TaxID=1323400 RepID=A0ABQ9K562_9CUCU|nr:hypothetical protein NQ317_015774 [Molorchus minor]